MKDDLPVKTHVRDDEISGEWDSDNQQWWNQYMASADNEIAVAPGPAVEQTPVPADVGPLPKQADLEAELKASYELDPACDYAFQPRWLCEAEAGALARRARAVAAGDGSESAGRSWRKSPAGFSQWRDDVAKERNLPAVRPQSAHR